MSGTLPNRAKTDLLTSVDRPSPLKAELLTRRESGSRLVREGIRRSGLLLKEVIDKDHGQASREIDGKEKLDFLEMLTWPPAVWRELLPLIALHVCAEHFVVERTVVIKEKSA